MNERESLQDLAADYALGLLGPEETAAFELELAQSPGLQLIVRECREALAVLPGGIQSPAPAADLRARVIARALGTPADPAARDATDDIGSAAGTDTGPAADDDVVLPITSESPVARAPRRHGSSAGWWMALAASLIAATGLGVLWRSALRAGQAALVREAALRASVDSVSKQLAARDATLRAILAPGVELHLLRSTGAPEPGIEFFWNKKSHSALMYAFNLTPSAKGRTYQLWMIQGDKRIPSVTFEAGSDGHALVDKIAMPPDLPFEALAVTDEPAGGSAQPTTPVLLVASIGS
ncbi:MAG TPA: anti-sigma factor [Gemmatimonadales bacterium]|nr:anti-sigma factor [Gemmatimonadales bacterium]